MNYSDLYYGLCKNKKGEYIIFPLSKYGKGYVISNSKAKTIKMYANIFSYTSIIILSLLAHHKFVYFLIAFPIGLLFYGCGLYLLVKNSPISEELCPYGTINKDEYFHFFACRQGMVKSIILLVIGILFVVGSIVIFIAKPSERLSSVGLFIFFGFGLLLQIKIVRCLLKNKSNRYNKSSNTYNKTP